MQNNRMLVRIYVKIDLFCDKLIKDLGTEAKVWRITSLN